MKLSAWWRKKVMEELREKLADGEMGLEMDGKGPMENTKKLPFWAESDW